MERIALMVLRLIIFVPYWFIKICLWSKNDNHTEAEKFALLKHITTRANHAGRVIIDSHGVENLPDTSGFIMFPNHQGLFDVLAFLESCPLPFTVVMKKEVENAILVKQIRLLLKAQCIDRSDIRNSMKVINQMTEEVKSGRNYIIFAEGTRTKNPNQLLAFKGGSFKSAVNAGCPIVPVALIDSYKPFDIHSIAKATVQIHYLKPIYPEEYAGMKTTEIAGLVHDRIEQAIRENEGFPT